MKIKSENVNTIKLEVNQLSNYNNTNAKFSEKFADISLSQVYLIVKRYFL